MLTDIINYHQMSPKCACTKKKTCSACVVQRSADYSMGVSSSGGGCSVENASVPVPRATRRLTKGRRRAASKKCARKKTPAPCKPAPKACGESLDPPCAIRSSMRTCGSAVPDGGGQSELKRQNHYCDGFFFVAAGPNDPCANALEGKPECKPYVALVNVYINCLCGSAG